MSPETREALVASIAHWERLVAGVPGERVGRSTCALCVKFNREDLPLSQQCIGCPIMARTGKKWCADTPYEWVMAYGLDDPFGKGAADAELDFLRDLLAELDARGPHA